MYHNFDIEFAKKYGVDEAIIFNNIQYWIEKNKANNIHFYDGRYWTYNSIAAFVTLFPYWSKGQIERILNSLINQGVLVSANYNKHGYDKTRWFSINYASLLISRNQEMDDLVSRNANLENETPIPDKKNVSNIYMSDFAKMQNKEERIAKAFHSLFERDNEVWRKASLEKWVGDLKKLMNKLKQKETSLVAIYTEIAMQKVQLYKCRSFHYETYFSIESLGKKQKNGEYVYESILALARKMHETNQKWIEEYNKNIKKFESWN